MMSWMNPQQYQMWASRTAAPAGWAGPWPPQAPRGYPGPPPPPPGVDHTVWYGGQWQFNPMYQGPVSAAAPMQAWAPHPSWGPAVMGAAMGSAAAAAFNPYKRTRNPGDAEYWNTKLSDNPLGLENMIPSEELWKQEQEKLKQQQQQRPGEAPQTPWLWVPKELSKSDERNDQRSNTRDGRSAGDLQNSQRPHEHRHHHSHTHSSHANQVSSANGAQQPPDRPPATPAPPSTQQQGSQGPTQAPYPFFHDRNGNYIRSRTDSTAPRSTATPVPTASSRSQPQQKPRVTSPPPVSQSSTNVTSASEQARQREAEKAFSSQKQLQPTFSPNIVRTPQHYVGAPSSADPRSSRRLTRGDSLRIASPREGSRSRYADIDDRDNDSPPPPRDHKHGPIYASTPTPTPSRSSSQVIPPSIHRAASPSRQSSLPSLSSSMSTLSISTTPTDQSSSLLLSGFTDEPVGMLSPLIVNAPAPSSTGSKEVSRSHTYPTLSAPPTTRTFSGHSDESSPSSRSSKTPRPSPGQTPSTIPKTPKTPRTPGSVSRSRTYPSLDEDPPVIPPMPSPPRSRAASPPRSATSARNPLPVPPMPSTYHVSSASAAARSHSQSQQPQPQSQSYPYSRSVPQSQSSQHTSSSTVRTVSASSAAAAAAATAIRSSYGSSTPAPVIPPLHKVRYGYWNRRGDHLVIVPPSPKSASPSSPTQYTPGKMYIVYAPHAQANPEELRDYPPPTEGWKDHRSRFLKYDGNVPELPDSLPLHGEPPRRPYETFLHYVDAHYR